MPPSSVGFGPPFTPLSWRRALCLREGFHGRGLAGAGVCRNYNLVRLAFDDAVLLVGVLDLSHARSLITYEGNDT
jgi:hypothetical protein